MRVLLFAVFALSLAGVAASAEAPKAVHDIVAAAADTEMNTLVRAVKAAGLAAALKEKGRTPRSRGSARRISKPCWPTRSS
ncbi:hypothetical protein [Limnoglobus roseus]|uniref:Uncharacterized protein n=1 Tax=Limnoglobus roseus TaxID=2598579 RepID=A0A5C1AM50_9BACT|nr:hypothetical protein [Limnoglobus roseus]QEL20489.1 hypothetical protein PX52LOC_07591 [Limnoglobus roseus]